MASWHEEAVALRVRRIHELRARLDEMAAELFRILSTPELFSQRWVDEQGERYDSDEDPS